jgi:PHD/YefM family antitoxin component YafN of YafNO toxin-antitoxin module
MAVALRSREENVVRTEALGDLVARLSGGPVVVESRGEAVAVLLDVERYREMQAVYEWHSRLREERRAS